MIIIETISKWLPVHFEESELKTFTLLMKHQCFIQLNLHFFWKTEDPTLNLLWLLSPQNKIQTSEPSELSRLVADPPLHSGTSCAPRHHSPSCLTLVLAGTLTWSACPLLLNPPSKSPHPSGPSAKGPGPPPALWSLPPHPSLNQSPPLPELWPAGVTPVTLGSTHSSATCVLLSALIEQILLGPVFACKRLEPPFFLIWPCQLVVAPRSHKLRDWTTREVPKTHSKPNLSSSPSLFHCLICRMKLISLYMTEFVRLYEN